MALDIDNDVESQERFAAEPVDGQTSQSCGAKRQEFSEPTNYDRGHPATLEILETVPATEVAPLRRHHNELEYPVGQAGITDC
jgi:hypothetical protein